MGHMQTGVSCVQRTDGGYIARIEERSPNTNKSTIYKEQENNRIAASERRLLRGMPPMQGASCWTWRVAYGAPTCSTIAGILEVMLALFRRYQMTLLDSTTEGSEDPAYTTAAFSLVQCSTDARFAGPLS